MRKLTNHVSLSHVCLTAPNITLHSQVHDKLERLAAGLHSPGALASAAASAAATPRSSFDARSLSSGRARSEHAEARARPEDQYEILCNDVVLPLDMTLAAVRQFVWRQSAELVMHYRRKRVLTPGSVASGHGVVPAR